MIESATAVGSGLTIHLKSVPAWRVEMLFNRSALEAFRLTAVTSGNRFIFPRDAVLEDGGRPGLFAAYVGAEPS